MISIHEFGRRQTSLRNLLVPTILACIALTVGFFLVNSTVAQPPTSTVPEVGVRDRAPQHYALVNAKIITAPGDVIENGTIVIDGGIITAVGGSIETPATARVLDMKGRTIYPALIEPYAEFAASEDQDSDGHWNKHVRPERSAVATWKGNDNQKLRNAGFAVSVIAPQNGILQGTSAAVSLGSKSPANSIIKSNVAQHLRLTSPRGRSRSYYPNSPMGAVALARQTFYDAKWYDNAWRAFRNNGDVPRPESNTALEALSSAIQRDALFIFDTPDEQYSLRANRFAVEFGLNRVALRGSGREYQRLEPVVATGHTIILPLNFPKAPNVATPEAARDASLSELMHWQLAPSNPARLVDAGASIVFTSHGLDNKSDFKKRIRKSIEHGLNADVALSACTIDVAKLIGIENKAGTIAAGKAANLMICDGDWLAKKTKVTETWIDGERFEHDAPTVDDLSGTWKLALKTKDEARSTLYLSLKQAKQKLTGKASTEEPAEEEEEEEEEEEDHDHAEHDEHEHEHGADSDEGHDEKEDADKDADKEDDSEPKTSTDLKKAFASFGRLTANFSAEIWGEKNTVRLSGTLLDGNRLVGELIDENGKRIKFTGKLQPKEEAEDALNDGETAETETDEKDESNDSKEAVKDEKDKDEKDKDEDDDEEDQEAFEVPLNYPLGAYGVSDPNRKQASVLIENATVWTSGPDGILKNASILVEDGKIIAVGSDLKIPKGVQRINAKGKHVTPGIIDCHSHMATDGGVNEGTQAITAEVRIGDFIDATDISIYRQLAGGVTTANILHGSANPIGGQNQVIKLRWGQLPESMKFAEAPGGIKFALGENVKQSNWSEEHRTRYPQSRLGVEQIMRDAFIAAKEYEKQWATWRATGNGIPPRKDIELDTLLQIVNRERWIHCHSYRQDEILSLIRTLDDFGITIGTFQHILEGYKVAKEMAEHGAMGSSFADWWAYKFEVYDAIPYNGALMHSAGVVVSFNSDDAELARHLNHEAAKAVKYGGVPREEALKFVTLNPAKQLRIDKYVGSIEPGKHADLAIWSGDPLQITSRCEQTWIDGVRYFDIDADKATRKTESELREKLVRQILDSGEPMRKPGESDGLWRHLFPRHDEYCGHGHDH